MVRQCESKPGRVKRGPGNSLVSPPGQGVDVVPGAPMPCCEQRWLELKQAEKSGGNGSSVMGDADRPDGLDNPTEIAQRINSASVPGWCKELQIDWEFDSFCMNEGLTVAHLVKNPPAMQETWV